MPRLTAIRRQALDGIMKEAIFEATVAVLSEHGVERMTMDRVASAAKVAKGSLYNYFPGKKSLLEFVYTKTLDPVLQTLRETVAADQPAIEKLSTHLINLLEHCAKHARIFHLLFHDEAAQGLLQSSQRSSREAGSQHLAEIFRQGIAEGVFVASDPLLLARMFIGLCGGVFDSHPPLQERDERERIFHLIMSTFLNGVATESGRTNWLTVRK
jgi:AcrR family transcriptional regulator